MTTINPHKRACRDLKSATPDVSPTQKLRQRRFRPIRQSFVTVSKGRHKPCRRSSVGEESRLHKDELDFVRTFISEASFAKIDVKANIPMVMLRLQHVSGRVRAEEAH